MLKSIIRKAGVTIAAATCAGFFAGTLPGVRAISGPRSVAAGEQFGPRNNALQAVSAPWRTPGGPSPSIAPSSRPVLDYAVQTLERYPEALVYVSGQGDSATVQREAQAVARYLEQRGIAANRLVLASPIPSRQVDQRPLSASHSDVVVLNFTLPNCATCS